MANGKEVFDGAVAIRLNSKVVQNMDLEYGDKIFIEGIGEKYIGDRLPDFNVADIDIFMSVEECKKFGRQNVIIEKI